MKITPRAEMAPKMIKKRQSTEPSETRSAEGAKSRFLAKSDKKSKKVILERKSDFGAKK